jgi:hypothetical protein
LPCQGKVEISAFHENFANPNNNVFSASGAVNGTAGVITASNFGSTPRQIQFGLKVTF